MKEKLLFNMGKWYATYDENGNCTSAVYDDEYRKLLGNVPLDDTDSEDVWKDIIHPEDMQMVDDNYAELFKKHPEGLDYNMEYRMMTPEGYHWFHDFGHCTRRKDGSIARMDGVIFDIQDILDTERIREELSENNMRIMALEDNFESMYDVNLETGKYEVFIKGETYDKEIKDKLTDINDYYEDLAENIEIVVYPEDKEETKRLLSKEGIKNALADRDHYDYYYRVIAGNRPVWFMIRLAYKDETKENAIIGVFNAEKDVEARRLAKQNILLEQERSRTDVIHEIIHSGKWSFFVNAQDEIVRSDYSEEVMKIVNNDMASGVKEWDELLHPDDKEEALKAFMATVKDHSCQTPYDVTYRMVDRNGEYHWFHSAGRIVRDEEGNGEFFGVHINIDDQIEEQEGRLTEEIRSRETQEKLKHEQLRSEMLNYVIAHDDGPIGLLENYAERIRELISCDQVIFRDLEEVRIMVNSPEIENTWAVPIDYCLQCEHLDPFHPMYKDGYTEMENCQEGWQGIPVYHKCPIKSSLTRIVYCNGEVAGYMAFHYVQDYHKFTDLERATLEEFTRIISVALSKYAALEENRQLKLINEMQEKLAQRTAISDYFIKSYSAAYYVDLVARTVLVLHASRSYSAEHIDEALPYEEIMPVFTKYAHPDDREKFTNNLRLENLREQLQTKEEYTFTYRDVSTESPGTYRCTVIPGGDENHVAVGFMDISEEIRREEEQAVALDLANQQRHIKAFGEMVNAALWNIIIDDNDNIAKVVWSNESRRMFGFEETEEDFPNEIESWTDRLHPDDKERTMEHFEESLKVRDADSFVFDNEFRILRKNNEYHWYRTAARMEFNEDGTRNLYGIIYDVSANKLLEEALSMAQSANRAKTTFLNNMSHDIRTPMNAIIGYTGLAASHIDNKEHVQDYLSKIAQSSDHLLSLINDVLDMSRIESGKMNIEEREENLSDIIHTLRDIVQADIRSKQLNLFVDAVDVNDENVICDKLRLNQVLLNILSNSIKYTPAGGTVIMRVTEKTVKPNGYGTYEFSIIDNGMGMDEEFLKTIFDPFTRVKSSTVSGIQGTGLGMAITKNIVDMMGGEIKVSSEPSKGTEVTITFDFKLQSAPKKPEEIPELKGVRALVADDDSDTCISICNMVKDIGMRFEWCTSGKEAVIRAEAAYQHGDSFKVFIIDWIMPDMNGIETTRRIRRVIGEDIPIIILTAYDWSDIEEEALEAGVTAFVSKPMFPSDLHRVLNRCLGREEEEAVIRTPEYNFSGKKVLLVEDNELNREIACEILEEDGFVVDTAEDGDIAVDIMRKAQPGAYDMILMDIQMPRMDGYEATRLIRELPSHDMHIPIIAMTANAFEEDRKAAFDAGMDEHIAKPIDIRTLKETLAKFL